MTYRIPTRVVKLENKHKHVGSEVEIKDDKTVTMVTTIDIGWFVLFEGSQESLYVGMEEPLDLQPGTEVDIVIEPKK
jgi:hypothetical protein